MVPRQLLPYLRQAAPGNPTSAPLAPGSWLLAPGAFSWLLPAPTQRRNQLSVPAHFVILECTCLPLLCVALCLGGVRQRCDLLSTSQPLEPRIPLLQEQQE